MELRGSLASLNRFLALPVRGQANATITPDSFSFGGSLRADVRGITEVPDGTYSGTAVLEDAGHGFGDFDITRRSPGPKLMIAADRDIQVEVS